MTKRNIEVEYGIRQSTNKEEIDNEIEKEQVVKNLKITRYDISRISNILGEKDNIERIYINFCNPWPRGKHHKKRLATIKSLQRSGYGIEKITYDLANEENFWNGEKNIETEHEAMFKEQNIKIKALIAKYT